MIYFESEKVKKVQDGKKKSINTKMYPMDIRVPSYQPPPPLSCQNESRTLQPSRNNNNTTTSASANTNLQATADLVSKLHPNTTINMNNSSDVVIG